jgi:hypothetical protein
MCTIDGDKGVAVGGFDDGVYIDGDGGADIRGGFGVCGVGGRGFGGGGGRGGGRGCGGGEYYSGLIIVQSRRVRSSTASRGVFENLVQFALKEENEHISYRKESMILLSVAITT